MQIEYNILFIENEYEWIDSIEEFLNEYLDEKWFTLNLQRSKVFPTTISDFNAYDIIVVDFNLDENETGDEAIKRIRQSGEVYTEIFFYSSIWEDAIRKKLVELWGFDWVYCSDRKDDFKKNLTRLINTTIRKSQDLNNLRGLVMAETSELDNLIKELTRKIVIESKVSTGKIEDRKSKLSRYYSDNINELNQIKDFLELLDSKHFTAYFWWRTLCSFSDCSMNNLSKDVIEPYKNDIIELRNLLAHNPEESSTHEVMNIKKPNWDIEPFRESDFIRIRKSIRTYKDLLIGLYKNV